MCLGEDGCLHYHVNPGKLPQGLGGGWAWVAGVGGGEIGVLRPGPHSGWEGGPPPWNPEGPIKKTDNGISLLFNFLFSSISILWGLKET